MLCAVIPDSFYVPCNCPDSRQGEFCENCNCYPDVTCDPESRHCGTCPAGLKGDGTKCYGKISIIPKASETLL